jgi:hypothetical protein
MKLKTRPRVLLRPQTVDPEKLRPETLLPELAQLRAPTSETKPTAPTNTLFHTKQYADVDAKVLARKYM